MQVTNAWCCR